MSRPRSLGHAALVALVTTLAACNLLAGVDDRGLGPPLGPRIVGGLCDDPGSVACSESAAERLECDASGHWTSASACARQSRCELVDSQPTCRPSELGAGRISTCFLASRGVVSCWGDNQLGSLGVGDPEVSAAPIVVPGLIASKLSVGESHACAIDAQGIVYCWGHNDAGEVGDGTLVNRSTPTRVALPEPAVSVSAGLGISCAAVASGDAYCWGKNLGGLAEPSSAPSLVKPTKLAVNDVARVVAGFSDVCALPRSPTDPILCFGSLLFTPTPTPLEGFEGATTISLGEYHYCGIVDGQAKCAGDNVVGQLCLGLSVENLTKPLALDVGPAADIRASFRTTCVLGQDGGVACCGRNDHGQAGTGTTGDPERRAKPVQLPPESTAIGITVGWDHACAELAQGGVYCWGANGFDQLGISSPGDYATPQQVEDLTL